MAETDIEIAYIRRFVFEEGVEDSCSVVLVEDKLADGSVRLILTRHNTWFGVPSTQMEFRTEAEAHRITDEYIRMYKGDVVRWLCGKENKMTTRLR